jgi:DNA polymerase-3 subunit gamma/tau
MARVFAAAVNCSELSKFQKNPKIHTLPCLTCVSCNAMQEGNHPDFIEIDAASHTGVDNMRAIIESSSLLPILGKKRIYLIDEAHMLSKAAFNAALKILEEPPATALFILATTHPYKIIDTVRSRSFQLFFTPLAHEALKKHLAIICEKENILYDNEALDCIISNTHGSARDALNMLERVRFASSIVSQQAVGQSLGHINDKQIIDIIITVTSGTSQGLLELLHTISFDHYSAEFIWNHIITCTRALIWAYHGVKSTSSVISASLIQHALATCTLAHMYALIETMYSYEDVFLKTTKQHTLLEMILLSLCNKNTKKNDNENTPPASVGIKASTLSAIEPNDMHDTISESEIHSATVIEKTISPWELFLSYIESFSDPVLISLFKQALYKHYDISTKTISVEFPKDFTLFKDRLETSYALWSPVLKKAFNDDISLESHFTGVSKADKGARKISMQQRQADMVGNVSQPISKPIEMAQEKLYTGSSHKPFVPRQSFPKKEALHMQKNEVKIDVSNIDQWPKASLLLRYFPGVITEMREHT